MTVFQKKKLRKDSFLQLFRSNLNKKYQNNFSFRHQTFIVGVKLLKFPISWYKNFPPLKKFKVLSKIVWFFSVC